MRFKKKKKKKKKKKNWRGKKRKKKKKQKKKKKKKKKKKIAPENMKKPSSKVAHNHLKFFFSTANQPKTRPNLRFFHRNLPLHDFSIMTLIIHTYRV